MPGLIAIFPHLLVIGRREDVAYRSLPGRGTTRRIRDIGDRRAHAERLTEELAGAEELARRELARLDEELRGDGFILTVQGWSAQHQLALDSLDTRGAKLLSFFPATEERPDRVQVWMPFTAVEKFIEVFEQYAREDTRGGKPKNQPLVANIADLRLTVLQDLWQEEDAFPDEDQPTWWELWLVPVGDDDPIDTLKTVADRYRWRIAADTLTFAYRSVALVQATARELGVLLTTNAIPSELRRSHFVEDVLGIEHAFQLDLVTDLVDRTAAAADEAPAVCVLDTGVFGEHPLLKHSLDGAHVVLSGVTSADRAGHGTEMAGLALYGDLESLLHGGSQVRLLHRLESVKIIRDSADDSADPELYGAIVAQATGRAESETVRPRAYSLAVTTSDISNAAERPTSWSAALDALSFGSFVAPGRRKITLAERPDPKDRRLFLVSAGNVPNAGWHTDHLAVSDLRPIRDPAQSWNALTVGAYTERVTVPESHAGWTPVAPVGELSPFSSTGVPLADGWPIKPDIVLEGGNLLSDTTGQFDTHDVVSVLTTSNNEFSLLTTTNATSAATAQAARLAAMAMARYPGRWPETIRGLLVHAAEWTPAMKAHFPGRKGKKIGIAKLIKRHGWGVPTETQVLASGSSDVTLIVEDEFLPFELRKGDLAMPRMRLSTTAESGPVCDR